MKKSSVSTAITIAVSVTSSLNMLQSLGPRVVHLLQDSKQLLEMQILLFCDNINVLTIIVS